ncbi:MAG: eukaryotic-like serine/threonine-protein kinase, partial [Actinomycetota bacterium]|nr:eukaryotic-like serine/threonine-protein kinase [Actinomycetota bacterium]
MNEVDFGLPGVGLEPGDHICAVYMGEQERRDIIGPYLRAGLAAGHKCICVVDTAEHETVRRGVGNDQEVEAFLQSEQLEILSEMETYLRDGAFSVERMIEFWDEAVGTAIADRGYSFSRAVGDTS